MKKVLKWIGGILAVVLFTLAVSAFYVNAKTQGRLSKKYDVSPRPVAVPTDSAALAAGQQWAAVLCSNCHGENLAGTAFINSPDLGTVNAPNLTPGGPCKDYDGLDWARAIRHGVGKDGHPLLIMPAKDFQHMSDEHLGQLIAYLKTLPAVEQSWAPPKTTFLFSVLFHLGALGDVLNAEHIDHAKPPQVLPQKDSSVEYGGYLVQIGGCRTCHGEQLNGGKDPNPEAPMGPNLTPGGSLKSWGGEGFVKAMRTGVTPAGKELNGKFMPWKELGKLDDGQLQAIFAYLMAQPELQTAEVKK